MGCYRAKNTSRAHFVASTIHPSPRFSASPKAPVPITSIPSPTLLLEEINIHQPVPRKGCTVSSGRSPVRLCLSFAACPSRVSEIWRKCVDIPPVLYCKVAAFCCGAVQLKHIHAMCKRILAKSRRTAAVLTRIQYIVDSCIRRAQLLILVYRRHTRSGRGMIVS